MVRVDMTIATSPDELAGIEARLLCEHVDEEGIGGDVKRHAEEAVGTALVQLAGELAAGHVKLKQKMARGERHLIKLANVPGADDHPSRIRVRTYSLDNRLHLVDHAAVGRFPSSPLFAVDGAEIAGLLRPVHPHCNSVHLASVDVLIAVQKP